MNKRTLCLRTTANLRRHWAKHGTYSMTINEQTENGLGPDLLKVGGSEDAEHTAAELVKRWNAYPELVAKLQAIVDELERYDFIGVQGAAEHDESHWSSSPSIMEAKALLNTL